jgi:hypothetical protein
MMSWLTDRDLLVVLLITGQRRRGGGATPADCSCFRLPSPRSPGSSTNTGADSAKCSLTTDSAPFGAKQRHKKIDQEPARQFRTEDGDAVLASRCRSAFFS